MSGMKEEGRRRKEEKHDKGTRRQGDKGRRTKTGARYRFAARHPEGREEGGRRKEE